MEHGIAIDDLIKLVTLAANLIAIPAVKGIWTLIRKIELVEKKQAIMLQALIDKGLIKPFGELMGEPENSPTTTATEK